MKNKTEHLEFLEFIEVMQAETPATLQQINRLWEIANSLQRYHLAACNTGLTPRQEAREAVLEAEAKKICEAIGVKGKSNSDPRGFSWHIYLPSGRSNSWGGEVWGIGY